MGHLHENVVEECQSFDLYNLCTFLICNKILPDVPESVGLVMVDVTAGGILLCLGCCRGTCMKIQGKYVNQLSFVLKR